MEHAIGVTVYLEKKEKVRPAKIWTSFSGLRGSRRMRPLCHGFLAPFSNCFKTQGNQKIVYTAVSGTSISRESLIFTSCANQYLRQCVKEAPRYRRECPLRGSLGHLDEIDTFDELHLAFPNEVDGTCFVLLTIYDGILGHVHLLKARR
jgi:hypothetical protein